MTCRSRTATSERLGRASLVALQVERDGKEWREGGRRWARMSSSVRTAQTITTTCDRPPA